MKDDYDGAEPSGNATAALALAELGRLTDDPRWIEASRRILDWLGERMRRLPQAVPHALLGLQRYHEPPARLVLAGPWPSQDLERLRRAAGSVYRPDVLMTRADGKHPSELSGPWWGKPSRPRPSFARGMHADRRSFNRKI